MKKVSIIGAGNVGAQAAFCIAQMRKLALDEVVLLDVKPGIAEGKAIDIAQSGSILGFDCKVIGVTSNYEKTKDSDVIVITSGIPRKPGMTREELVGVNSGIVKSVLNISHKFSPNAKYVIVTNPMDTMTYLAIKYLEKLGKKDSAEKVLGMGGILDSARFCYYIAEELGCDKLSYICANVYGAHGDTTMVPDPSKARKISDKIEVSSEVIEKTKKGGATITNLLGTSAWFAPAAGIARTVDALMTCSRPISIPCSVWREEYGVCIGSLARVSVAGVVEVPKIDIENTDEYKNSIEATKKVNSELGEI